MALKITCGFGRVGVRESKLIGLSEEEKQTKKFCQSNLDQRYKAFKNIYGGRENELSFQDFGESVKHVEKVLNNWGGSSRDEKAKFLEHFSLDNWKKLSTVRKAQHAIVGPCKACSLDHKPHWDLYNKQIRCARVRNALCASSEHVQSEANVRVVQNERSKKRKLAQEIKSKIEAAQRIHNKDVEVAYGIGESLEARRKRRLAEEFETTEEAERRTKQRKIHEEQGHRTPKNRLGNFEAWATFDREKLKQEVEGYEDGAEVNWTELARTYHIRKHNGEVPANVGQLLKLWLQKENVDTERFKQQPTTARVRRARMKVGGGTNITVPKKRTERQISKELSIMIKDGEVSIGEYVVPKTFKKYYVNKDTNRVDTKTVTIEGRKQPLPQLREKLLQSQKPFMRDARNYDTMTKEEIQQRLMELGEYDEHKEETEEDMRLRLQGIEGTRYIMCWEDGATLANHGYILYLVATMYDPAIHLTDREYHQKFNLRISVQSKVEQPQIYLIARSGSSDVEQLLYAETRRDDLPSLSLTVKSTDGREYTDILRIFKGDNHAREFELGQQRGGHHPCLCSVDIRNAHSYWACCHVEKPAPTIQDRQEFILQGPVTCLKAASSLPDPFSQLTKDEMQDELTYRGAVPYESVESLTKKELQQEMKRVLHGIKRMPTLLQPNPTQSLTELNIQHLEAPASESMHDIYNHTKNILEELPAHVCKEVAETIQTVKQTVLGDKDTIRASDMRELLLILTKELEQQGKATKEVMELLYSLVDIQKLCYAAADDRTTTTIYRLSNTVFKHHLMMKECFTGTLRNMSNRRLWGQYIHSIRDHTPVLYRISAISTLMAENEERHFATFKRITKTSANYANPGHIITNIFVRSHFNKNAGTKTAYQDNKISETAKLLPQLRTRIPISLLKKYPREAQTHCERVCDFLRPGYGTTWHLEGEEVVFHDSPLEDPPFHPTAPAMHHFRSTSIKQEHCYLQETWKRCLQEEVPMPLSKLWIYKDDGQTLSKKVTTPFLDTGYDFSRDKFSYMKENVATVVTEEEEDPEDEEMAGDDSVFEETVEEEEVIRIDRIDPEPELEGFTDSGASETEDQAAASQVDTSAGIPLQHDHPDQSPGRIRMERRGEGSTVVATPPRTPARGVETVRADIAMNGNSTPTSTRTGSVDQGMMTPPPTPCAPDEKNNRDKPKWTTKLGSALAVVLGEMPIVKRIDQVKAKLKTTPRNKYFRDEFDRCIAQVSGQLSHQLHKERKTFEDWEKDFIVQKGRVPIDSDVRHSEFASAVERKIRYAEHLLRTFGVNLQMTI